MKSLLLLAALATALALLVGGCRRGAKTGSDISDAERAQFQQELKTEAKKGAQSVQGLSGAVVKGGQIEIGDAQGRPLWRVQAKEIRASGQTENGAPKTATLTGASAALFRAGAPESKFQADTMQLFNTAAGVRLQMTGHVVATSQTLAGAPVEVRAPRADVDVGKRTLAASGGVEAKRGDILLRTPRLTGQTSLQTLQTAAATLSSQGAVVHAARANFNWKTNRLSAQTVQATRAGTTLTGAHLDADTRAQHGTLTGNVQAKAPTGSATGARLEWNWARDRIFVPNATFRGRGALVHTSALTTDSKLRVTDARNVHLEKDGVVLTLASARGLENLSTVSGRGVVFSRGDLKLDAGKATLRDWSKSSGVVTATGGVFARNSTGTLRSQSATWNGDAQTGHVSASGNVRITSPNGTLSGARAHSDAHFQNATMSGDVRGTLRNGTKISAATLEKRGDTFIASSGASAVLPDGTHVAASRVEGSGGDATATGGASATLPDGTKLKADRVQKRGASVVATGSVGASLRGGGGLGRVEVRASRVVGDANGAHVEATGGVTLRAHSGATIRAPRATFERATGRITATGGVTLVDPVRHLTQTGSSLVADIGLKEVTIQDVRGQGQTGALGGKGLF